MFKPCVNTAMMLTQVVLVVTLELFYHVCKKGVLYEIFEE